jgi:hypothetical protein
VLAQLISRGRTPAWESAELVVWRGQQHGGKVKFTGNAGRVKLIWNPHLVLVDWDFKACPSYLRIANVLRNVGLNPEWIRWDRTARGWHIIVRLRERLDRGTCVAVQLLLGSDRKREAFNLCRALSGNKSLRWNLLFEVKLSNENHQ